MKLEPEPFSTHRIWDERTTRAYHDQPTVNGKHFWLGAHCTEAQKAEWRAWCRKYPDLWPGHVKQWIAKIKAGQA